MFRNRAALHALTGVAITLSLGACSGVGKDEQAFCDAVERNDLAAAKALLDTGQIDMTAGGGRACSPALAVFEHASSRAPAFIPMAVALAKQPGVATRCFGNARPPGRPGDGPAKGRRGRPVPSILRRRTARQR